MVVWTYKAKRDSDGVIALVEIRDDETTRSYPLRHFVRHSPTGFEMGYGGSGPADLAYSILVHYFLSYKLTLDAAKEEASAHYQAFKWQFIAPAKESVMIRDGEIEEWWVGRRQAGKDPTKYVADSVNGEKVTLRVRKTATKTELKQYGSFLVSSGCTCEHSEFLCYPGDGECSCGIFKHHVHCKLCGGVSQIG